MSARTTPEPSTPSTDVYEPGWVSKRQAMEILNKSDATIERLITQQKVTSKIVPRDGRKSERVFSLESLHQLKATLNAPPKPKDELSLRPKLDPAVILQLIQERQSEVVRALIESNEQRIEAERQSSKLWLTVQEAVEYSGLPKRALLAAIAADKVLHRPFGRRGSTLIQRASLDGYNG